MLIHEYFDVDLEIVWRVLERRLPALKRHVALMLKGSARARQTLGLGVTHSAGNGTAMRPASVGLVHLGDPYRIYRCFLASPEDFEQTLLEAVDAGHDVDTVAAMACTLVEAYQGYARLPKRLVEDLEFHDRLLELADGLHDLNRRLHGVG